MRDSALHVRECKGLMASVTIVFVSVNQNGVGVLCWETCPWARLGGRLASVMQLWCQTCKSQSARQKLATEAKVSECMSDCTDL